VAMPVVD